MFKLVISDDEGKTTVVPLVREEITIGRKEGNTIRLTERNVSRRHARLRKANGAFALEDLGSYNGVKVNGRRIEREATLKAGDQIAIGDYLLALQVDAAVETAADTVPSPGAPATADAATAMIAAPVEPVTPARLVMTSPPAPGAEFALSTARVRIGRAEDLDVWVNHRSISREHAQVLREGNTFRVVDMGSANGVRVNGQDVQQSPIRPGDVIELGQVRFRFVGEGETYTFDADRTIQVEPVMIQAKGSKAPWIAAIVLVLVAIPVASIIALSGGEQPPAAIPLDLVTQEGPAPVVPPPSPTVPVPSGPAAAVQGPDVSEAIAACRAAIAGGNWEAAREQAGRALASAPVNPDASRCLAEAGEGVILSNALGLAAGPDGPRRAYLAVQALPAESSMRTRPEFGRVVAGYYEFLLEQARVALQHNDNASVIEIADAMRAAADVPDELQRRAVVLRNQAARASTAVAVGPGPRTPRVTRPGGDRPVTGQGPDVRPPTGGNTQPPPTPAASDEWVACAAAGDQRCVIRSLASRPRLSAREAATLIEAFRATSDTPRMCSSMRDFVGRYPDNTRAPQYRQVLVGRCGGQ